MAPDTNHAAAAVDAYSLVVRAEVASELLNRARALIQERLHGEPHPEQAEQEHLRAKGAEISALQRMLDYRDTGHVEAVIARFGPLVRDEARFWADMNAPT